MPGLVVCFSLHLDFAHFKPQTDTVRIDIGCLRQELLSKAFCIDANCICLEPFHWTRPRNALQQHAFDPFLKLSPAITVRVEQLFHRLKPDLIVDQVKFLEKGSLY